ncbi:nuclear transport factor 2 family protein [Paraneptunicella aestuarii]|nr:nuclear transport factor 2 family protein [Paraneptunicella aestuarii]
MKRLLLILVCGIFASNAYASGLSEQELKAKATQFLQAKEAKQQPSTTEADIDHFLSFFSDEFTDEHVKFNVTVTDKNEFKQGLMGKMQDEIAYNKIEIGEMLIGANVVAVKFTENGKVKPSHLNKFIEYSVPHIMVMEFDEKGLIKHLRRHHGK